MQSSQCKTWIRPHVWLRFKPEGESGLEDRSIPRGWGPWRREDSAASQRRSESEGRIPWGGRPTRGFCRRSPGHRVLFAEN